VPLVQAAVESEVTVPISEEVWEEQGREFARRSDSTAWAIGDWLVSGEQIDGEPNDPRRYERAVELSGLKYGTLRNRACVARAFPVSRRRDTLTFAHHAVVSRRKDAAHWLSKAARHNWSEKDFRRELSEANGRPQPKVRPKRIVLSLERETFDTWADAAGDADLKSWVVATVNAAVAGEGDVPA
jgi:hypothetical protein